eukprot:TRINITY_DN6792_c0_g1_i1.p1 TRINITY_DN6792_c0_g1~~TRINITY_DN6792_c0_g1_i1.p1  ORF type:complete len:886 (+),score=244.24 TRINITY_DN6792_c0_g1_i1:285-2660(+)
MHAENAYSVATAHKSNLIKIWSVTQSSAAGDKLEIVLEKHWKGQDFPVTDMTFDPTGSLLATGSVDRSVRVWNVQQGFATHNFKGHSQMIDRVVFHPKVSKKHMKLYVGARDGQMKCWDLLTKTATDMQNHVSSIASIVFCPKRDLVLSLGRDKVVNIWSASNSQHLKTVPVYDDLEVLETLDNDLFITGGTAGSLNIWKLAENESSGAWTFKKIDEHFVTSDILALERDELKPVAIQQFVRFNKFLTVVTDDNNLHMLTMKKDEESIEFHRLKMLVGFNDQILHVKYFPDGIHVAVVTNSNQIRVFNTLNSNTYLLVGHKEVVLTLDVSACGNYLISGGKDAVVILWKIEADVETKLLKFSFLGKGLGHTEAVSCVAFAHKSLAAVSTSSDRTLKLWNCKSIGEDGKLQCVKSVIGHQKDINCVKFAPNDNLIGSSSLDKTVKIWNAKDLTLMNTFSGHKRGVWDIAFSPVEKCLVSASADKTIKLWSLNAANSSPCLKTFEGHTTSVLRVDFINAGMQLLSAGSDGLLKLWIIKTNECSNTFADEHDDKITAMCLAGDKLRLVTGGTDSVLNFWEDCTSQEAEKAELERQQFLTKDQELQNRIRQKDYLSAVKLAIELKHPRRLYGILEELIVNGSGTLDSVIAVLTADELLECLRFIRDWNVNSKKSIVAQGLLSRITACRGSLFSIFEESRKNLDEDGEQDTEDEKDERMTKGEFQEIIDAITAYTERHLQRANALYQQSFLIDYILLNAKKTSPLEEFFASNQKLGQKRKSQDVITLDPKRQRVSL